MDDISKYWRLNKINTLGRCQSWKKQDAKDFIDRQIYGVDNDQEIVRQLWQLYQGEDYPLAEVCLRCVISHYMELVCSQIAKQYGEKHDFTQEELLILVLEHSRGAETSLTQEFKQHQTRGLATQALGRRESILPGAVAEEDDELSSLGKYFREQYDSCFAKAVKEVIEAKANYYRSKKKIKDRAFIQALELYHCQTVAMGKIAEQIGFKGQPQVSRLLQEAAIRSDVARTTVAYLLPIIMEMLGEDLTSTEEKRREKLTPLLLAAVNQEMETAKKEASVSKNRVMNSRLSRTICQYLEQREQG